MQQVIMSKIESYLDRSTLETKINRLLSDGWEVDKVCMEHISDSNGVEVVYVLKKNNKLK